jgi:hypothetical protein
MAEERSAAQHTTVDHNTVERKAEDTRNIATDDTETSGSQVVKEDNAATTDMKEACDAALKKLRDAAAEKGAQLPGDGLFSNSPSEPRAPRLTVELLPPSGRPGEKSRRVKSLFDVSAEEICVKERCIRPGKLHQSNHLSLY